MFIDRFRTANSTLLAMLLVVKKGGVKNLARAAYRAAPLIKYLPSHLRMMRVLNAPPVSMLVERRPKLGYKYLYRPYLVASLTRKERLAILDHHYRFLAERVTDDFFARIYDGEIELWRDMQNAVVASITLAFPVYWEHDYEGDLLVNLHCDGVCIYSLTFTMVPGHVIGLPAPTLVLVAAVQGRAGMSERIAHIKDNYAALSPPMLLLAAVEGIALSLGISMLAGIGLDQQVQKQTWDNDRFGFDYDRFWLAAIGEKTGGIYYVKTLPEEHRPIEEIKGKHRKRTMQRRSIKTSIQETCRSAFEALCMKNQGNLRPTTMTTRLDDSKQAPPLVGAPPATDRVHLKRRLFRLLCETGVVDAWQFFRQQRRLSILCYHDPDPALFAKHLKALKAHFNIIALRDYVTARANGSLGKLPKYPLVITLDDGHMRNFDLLEAIIREKVPITIFLTSGVAGTYRHFWWTSVATEDELGELKSKPYAEMVRQLADAGFNRESLKETRQALSCTEIHAMAPYVDFQGHTRFHPVLPMCGEDEAKDEIAGCKNELEKRFSLDIYALAYPHGRYGERDIALAKDAGYACAVTVEEGLNDLLIDPFQLKRMYILDDADPTEVVAKASGLWTALRRLSGRTALGAQQYL